MRRQSLLALVGLVLVPAGGASVPALTYLPETMVFVDAKVGFVELVPTRGCMTCTHRIQKTTDGGKTRRATRLRALPRPPGERRFRAGWRRGSRHNLQLAAVVNARVAWATLQREKGGVSRLFVSVNAGASWRQVRLPCARPYLFWRPLVAAVSARQAWLLCLGQPAVGQQNKAPYETRDGHTWMLRRNLSGLGYGQRLAFVDSGFGLLAESRGGLLVTRDGGRTWSSPRITSPEEAEPQAIALFSRDLGLVLVRDDRSRRQIELFRTQDAGLRWGLLHTWR